MATISYLKMIVDQKGSRWLSRLAWLLWVVTAGLLLYGSVTLFYAFRYRIYDHGIYTNFLWNSAHGELFRYLVGESYLSIHLSYTLLLLAPLFHVWDHPFLLSVVQWVAGVGGSLLVGWIARRAGLNSPLPVMLMMFALVYPFTQRVLSFDFHGVCLYYLLFPALYGCALFRKNWAWLPVVLIAGLREDAALLAAPLLAWVAFKECWRAGWILAGLSVAYAVFAIVVLFPWLNGGSTLYDMRSGYVGVAAVASTVTETGMIKRVVATVWMFLPVALIIRRREWWPVAIIPSVAMVIALCSGHAAMNSFVYIYSAAPFTLVVLALLEALRLRASRVPDLRPVGVAVCLLGVTLAAMLLMHRIGPQDRLVRMPRIWKINPTGLASLRVARELPPDGLLLTSRTLAGMTANRRDMTLSVRRPEDRANVQYVFMENDRLDRPKHEYWRQVLETGEYGVKYNDHHVTYLAKGGPTNRNAEVLTGLRNHGKELPFRRSFSEGGTDSYVPGRGEVRYWPGGKATDFSIAEVSIGPLVRPGRYRAMVLLKVGEGSGPSAVLTLRTGGEAVLARAELTGPAQDFGWQDVPFEVTTATNVSVVVSAGSQPIWLDRIQFFREGKLSGRGDDDPEQKVEAEMESHELSMPPVSGDSSP